MSRKLLTIFLLCFAAGAVFAQGQITVPYMLKAGTPPTLDGDLTEWAFAFPIVMNEFTEPDGGRSDANFGAADDNDLSGTIYMMWDDNNLYFAAAVKDDVPGATPAASWAADGIEIYLSNKNIGNVLHGQAHGGIFYDEPNGDLEVQLFIFFDATADTTGLFQFFPQSEQGLIRTGNFEIFAALTPDEDGYILEGRIGWDVLASSVTNNRFAFTGGERVPATWSLIDIDNPGQTDIFHARQFPVDPTLSPTGNPGGPVWEVLDVRPAAPAIAPNDSAFTYIDLPYAKRPDGPVTLDGDLTEWAFAFPIVMNELTEPDGGRSDVNFGAADDNDLSGTIYMMWDENNLYFAATVKDDVPGATPAASWAADGIEIYLSNKNIGTALHGQDHGGIFYDEPNGDLEVQLFIFFDATADTTGLFQFFPQSEQGLIRTGNFDIFAALTPDEDGYILEGRIGWDVLASSATNNRFAFTGGERVPATWSLIDIDNPGQTDIFHARQFPRHPALSPTGNPGGQVWQSLDFKGISFAQNNIITGVEEKDHPQVARSFGLEQNYPNPFNPSTEIKFTLDRPSNVSLKIYNLAGQLVQTVIDNAVMQAGAHTAVVDMSRQPTGVYFYTLQQGNRILAKKMLLVK
jgi:hypothetical protein